MQKQLSEVAPYLEPAFGQGMKIFETDPVIKNRINEILGKGTGVAEPILKEFNAAEFLNPDVIDVIDPVTDPDGYKKAHEDAVKAAYEKGAQRGMVSKEVEHQHAVAVAEAKGKLEIGFNGLRDKHPELKSDLSIWDPASPMKPFLLWTRDNITDSFLLNGKNGYENAYAAYLSETGQLNGAFKNVEIRARTSFIREIDKKAKEAATVSRGGGGAAIPVVEVVPGVDSEKYLTDPVYRRQTFQTFYERGDRAAMHALGKLVAEKTPTV